MLNFTKQDNYIKFAANIKTNTNTNRIEIRNNTLIIHIKKPPVDGKANKEIINFLSSFFKISKSSVSIHKGEKSRNKQIILYNLTENDFIKKMENSGVFN